MNVNMERCRISYLEKSQASYTLEDTGTDATAAVPGRRIHFKDTVYLSIQGFNQPELSKTNSDPVLI
jgi:hypothetical protein